MVSNVKLYVVVVPTNQETGPMLDGHLEVHRGLNTMGALVISVAAQDSVDGTDRDCRR